MTDEEDMARDARSVACAEAPGQDVWKGLADLELEHARSCVRQARQTNHRLLTNMRISRNAGSAECRAAMRPIVAFIRGERSAFMARAWGHRNARNEWLEQAARSESEDTQPKATPTQDDVDALVEAGQRAIRTRKRFEKMRKTGLLDHEAFLSAMRELDAALTPFQKG